ncbi:ensconsin-like isoform X22 [Brachionus plicatilis]|uniref:Ensconsin-like isoform X22 n=1 Tax=Brachionus plicatilis TaxID=10195 RepID=A0A3M7P4B8_BRAPC|nr:ensconsin-like isoform X22 [Brachionus plicatilis]
MSAEPTSSVSEPQPAKHSSKTLPAHLQSFVNRLSMPKKSQASESSTARSSTPQPTPDDTLLVSKKSGTKPPVKQQQIDSATIKKTKPKSTNRKPIDSKTLTKRSTMTNSQSMNVINQSNGHSVKAAVSTCNLSEESKPSENGVAETKEEEDRASSGDPSKSVQSSSSSSGKTQEEEEYKRKLEEKRREAREKAAREAELERQRLEALRLEEEEKRRQEEEEQMRLIQLAREQEEERLRVAIQQEQERRDKEENDRRVKEEAERKARVDAERQERERLEKARKDEEERLERKKKVDMIMRRVQNKDENGSSNDLVKSNSNLNLLMTTSNNDLSNVLGTHNHTSSMTTSMIEHGGSSESKIKTPLLQSILSKTRINTILNKYADDPVLSSSTLSLIAQNGSQKSQQGKSEEKVEFNLQLNEVNVEVNEAECPPSTESNSSASSASSPVSTTSAENNDMNHQDDLSLSPSNEPITA